MASGGPIYTELLGAVAGQQPGFYSLFGTQDTHQTVVRDIVIGNISQTAAVCLVYWVYQAIAYDLLRSSVEANSSLHLELRQVVPVGAFVNFYTEGTNWTVAVTGYRFARAGATIGRLPALP